MIKRRRLSSVLLLSSLALALSSCGNKETLLFLNWGEYIDEELIDAFEAKYNCTVSMDLGDSNEIFYSKVRGGTTVYDVVCPSDYMIEKMYSKGMLTKLVFDEEHFPLSQYNPSTTDLRVGVKEIFNDMSSNLETLCESYDPVNDNINNYAVPYLWGTWGIMYSTSKEGVEEAVTKSKNQWSCLFDRSSLPAGTRVAMYDSHQHAYYAASRYFEDEAKINSSFADLSNTYGIELSNSDLDRMRNIIETMNYDAWGTDGIKKDIVAGNIDIGFMWTGDFLYYYAENASELALNAYLDKDIEITEVNNFLNTICDSSKRVYTSKSGTSYDIGFDCFIPNDTVAFCDNLAIPSDSGNPDLAYKFIDFMSSYQTASYLDDDGKEISDLSTVKEEDILTPHFANTYYVDYDATTIDVYNDLVDAKNYTFTLDDATCFDEEINDGVDAYDSTLYGLFYDYAIGIGFSKYYGIDDAKGTILACFDRSYINQINATFNNARA